MNIEEVEKQIHDVAHGPATNVVKQFNISLTEIKSICSLFPKQETELEPFIHDSGNRIQSIIDEAHPIALALEHADGSIAEIHGRQWFQQYREIQIQLDKKNYRPAQLPMLRRKLQEIKASFSKEFMELTTKQHHSLNLRFELVKYWKTVTIIEIKLFEHVQSTALEHLLHEAKLSGEYDLFDAIKSKLDSLKQQTYKKTIKISVIPDTLGNIRVLKDTIRTQLNEIVKLEQLVKEKHAVLKELSRIEADLNQEISQPQKPAHTPVATSTPNNFNFTKASRMAVTRKEES